METFDLIYLIVVAATIITLYQWAIDWMLKTDRSPTQRNSVRACWILAVLMTAIGYVI